MPFGSLSFSFVVLVHRIILILESYFLNCGGTMLLLKIVSS